MAFSKPKAFERAERYAAKGQHDKAAREYQSIVENDPKDVRAWLMLADCLVRTGDKVGAVERYERVAQYYVDAKEHNKALAVYRQVIALDAQRLDVQIKMAALNLQVGHTQDGIAIYERVAHAQLQLGRVADALNTYKLVADADPTVVARRLRLAELYSREKRMPEAVEAFRAAGRQLRTLGRASDFIRVAERLLYHEENDLPTIRDLARAYLELGDPRRALMKLNGLLRAHPKDEEGIELLADTFMALGKPEKALSALEELARGLQARGPAAKADAIRVLRRGLEWRPGHAAFREALTELEGRRRSPTPDPVETPIAAQAPSTTDEIGLEAVEAVEEGDLEELDEDDVVMDDVEPDTEPVSATVSLPEAASIAPGTRRTVELEALPSTEPSLTQSVLSEVEASAELAGGEGLTDFDKILFEARVYIKYRLFEHALEHVRSALQQQPQHVGALTVQAKALAELGRAEEAAEAHLAVAELLAGRDPKLAREQLAAARGLAPRHPRLEALAKALGPATATRVAAMPRRAPAQPVADDGDSGAFDLVSDSPPGIALDLADEPRANLASAEDEGHSTQPFQPIDLSQASSGVPPREHTPAAGFMSRPPAEHDTTDIRGSGAPPAEGRGPRRRLSVGRSPEEPARTGRTVTPYASDGISARDYALDSDGPDARTLEPESARTGRTMTNMPTVEDDVDAVTSEGLDFDGELDLDVDLDEPTVPPAGREPQEPVVATPAPKPSVAVKPMVAVKPVITSKPVAVSKPVVASKPVVVSKPVVAEPVATPEPTITPAGDWVDLTDELDEIQFYVDQGLDDDAEAALDDLEAIHPGHPQIAKFRGREPVGAAPAAAPEVVQSEPEPEPIAPEPEPEPVAPDPELELVAPEPEPVEPEPEPAPTEPVSPEPVSDEPDDGGDDLAASMLDLDIEPIEPEAEAAEPLVSLDDDEPAAEPLVSFADDDDDEDAYLSAIFADPVKKKPKARTEDSNPGANVADGQAVDAATAFDLGVAYREMGLVDAAITQFETAARDPHWRARALTLLGALRVHRGETDRAIADLRDAVRLASTPAEASEAAYELGVLYGVIGDSEAAIQQLLTVAPGYRDRDERLAELGF